MENYKIKEAVDSTNFLNLKIFLPNGEKYRCETVHTLCNNEKIHFPVPLDMHGRNITYCFL